MNCFTCERNLSAYLDDELPMDERLEVDAHLGECQPCRSQFESHQAAWEAAHLLAAEAAPDSLWQGIESQLGDEGPRAGLEELTLMVKGLAAEVHDLRRTVDGLRRWLERAGRRADWGEAEKEESEGQDILVRAHPFRPGRPREASIEQLRRRS